MRYNDKTYRYLPFLNWIRDYSSDSLRKDTNAGLTVGIMLIPQGMAYAVIAGIPPVYGLYASIVPLIIYALFGTSRQLSVGPVAMVAILVAAGVGQYAEPGSERFVNMAIMTAFGVGIVMLLMGSLRMGFIVNFLSHPVLSGFTSAAAIIIGTSQIKNLFGLVLPGTDGVHELLISVVRHAGTLEPVTAAMGISAVAVLVFFKKIRSNFPSALAIVIISTLVTALLDLDQYGLAIVGDIPGGLPGFDVSMFSIADFRLLLPTVLVISLVGYMESIAVAKAIAGKRGYTVDPDQELRAVGLANVAGSFFQSFPVAGGFSRTAVNDQSGASTGIASVISAAVIAITVLIFTPLFYYLPKSVLAAIIIVAVAGLFDLKQMKELWRTDKMDFIMLMITFLTTLAFGVEIGIATGVVISLAAVIYMTTSPHGAELGRLGTSRNYRNVERYRDAVVEEEILIYRFDSQLYFANCSHFHDTLIRHIERKGDKLELVILDSSAINMIDSTGVHTLRELILILRDRGVRFYIAGAIGPVRDKLKLSGLADVIGEESFFFEPADAVDYYKSVSRCQTDGGFPPLQTNC